MELHDSSEQLTSVVKFIYLQLLKIVALIPIPLVGVVLEIASKISREASGSGNPAAAWAAFPWTVTLLAGFLAMFVAAKVAYPGVPLSDLDKDNLSIR